VNAGAVHAYVQVPAGQTRYLADLKSGDPVQVVNARGQAQAAYVGRAKTERRPLILVTAEHKGREISLVLQNAETIRLTQPDGQPVSVARLRKGTEVVAYLEEAGRHFGMKVEETISEK
jgi:3-dehydroquinate synthase II